MKYTIGDFIVAYCAERKLSKARNEETDDESV
jgi:hypothetical protein